MSTFQNAKQGVEANLEQIQESRLFGICFLDSEGRLVQLIEEDPGLKDAVLEHYEERLRQMNLFEREAASMHDKLAMKAMLGDQVA